MDEYSIARRVLIGGSMWRAGTWYTEDWLD